MEESQIFFFSSVLQYLRHISDSSPPIYAEPLQKPLQSFYYFSSSHLLFGALSICVHGTTTIYIYILQVSLLSSSYHLQRTFLRRRCLSLASSPPSTAPQQHKLALGTTSDAASGSQAGHWPSFLRKENSENCPLHSHPDNRLTFTRIYNHRP